MRPLQEHVIAHHPEKTQRGFFFVSSQLSVDEGKIIGAMFQRYNALQI